MWFLCSFLSFFQMRRWLVMLLQERLIVDVTPAFCSPTATHWTTIISHQAPGLFAYSTQWPLHCGGVQCFAASCSFSLAYTLQKVSYHGVTWQAVVLMGFWSTFQEATYYSAYECVVIISTHPSACANSPLWWFYPWNVKEITEYFELNYWKFMVTHRHFNWHTSLLSRTKFMCCVRGLKCLCHTFSALWAL